MGEEIRISLESLAQSSAEGIQPCQKQSLYFLTRLYVASLGFVIQGQLHDVEQLKKQLKLQFWYGADRDVSGGTSLLSKLGPLAEAVWGLHKELLHSVTNIALSPGDRTCDDIKPLAKCLRTCKELAVSVASLFCVDYQYHLRKSLSESEYWDYRRNRLASEKLEGFPEFRGMRLQILSCIFMSLPRQDRLARLRKVTRHLFPFSKTIFMCVSPFVYKRCFQKHLQVIRQSNQLHFRLRSGKVSCEQVGESSHRDRFHKQVEVGAR
mmetsp:Transcript_12475/g.29638  ORF Transcript_12475/g.29638 Transcript_12475/m.29638 type:complete len:266 (+) Transcript_12475:953-1750(+)